MNWLGKVFVVLILILSLVFMGLAMAVFATHKNWRDIVEGQPNGLKAQLEKEKQAHKQHVDERDATIQELTHENDAEKQQIAKLETERVSLAENYATSQAELDKLRLERKQATAAVAATQELNQKLAADAATLSQNIRTEQQARDAAFQRTLNATEQLHQVKNDLESAMERTRQLTTENAGMTHVMREKGIDPKTPPGSVVPTVDGLVTQIRRTAGGQLIEVSIGADDGLKEGTTLEVYRGSKYLGRINVLETSPDKSVGQVDRRFQQGQIQEGDRVATRFKF